MTWGQIFNLLLQSLAERSTISRSFMSHVKVFDGVHLKLTEPLPVRLCEQVMASQMLCKPGVVGRRVWLWERSPWQPRRPVWHRYRSATTSWPQRNVLIKKTSCHIFRGLWLKIFSCSLLCAVGLNWFKVQYLPKWQSCSVCSQTTTWKCHNNLNGDALRCKLTGPAAEHLQHWLDNIYLEI